MKLTEFGKIVRKARLDAAVSLLEMATELGITSAFLSSLETGRKRIPEEWVIKIEQYFNRKGIRIPDIKVAADISNQSVSLEGLSPAHQMLVAGFARTAIDEEQMEKLKHLLEAANNKGNK